MSVKLKENISIMNWNINGLNVNAANNANSVSAKKIIDVIGDGSHHIILLQDLRIHSKSGVVKAKKLFNYGTTSYAAYFNCVSKARGTAILIRSDLEHETIAE